MLFCGPHFGKKFYGVIFLFFAGSALFKTLESTKKFRIVFSGEKWCHALLRKLVFEKKVFLEFFFVENMSFVQKF